MEFDLHGLTLVEAIRAYPEQATVVMQKQAMELAQQPNNSDYAAALNAAKEFRELFPDLARGFKWRNYMKWLGSRLNAQKAEHCA